MTQPKFKFWVDLGIFNVAHIFIIGKSDKIDHHNFVGQKPVRANGRCANLAENPKPITESPIIPCPLFRHGNSYFHKHTEIVRRE